MITALVLGGGLGLGLLLTLRALRPRPDDLGSILRRVVAPFDPTLDTSAPGRADRTRWSSRSGVVGRHVVVAGRVERNLRVVGRAVERHVVDKVTLAVVLGATAPAVFLAGSAAGLSLPPLVAVLGAVVGGIGGYHLPDLLLHTQAEERRRHFRFAMSSYLDLVNVLLAGGAGIESALDATASSGDGWAFHEIRAALTRARATRRSPWAALSELGEALGVDELVELAASIQLAGEEGARIRSSLAAKAAALRSRQLAQIEADAHSASERMGIPTVAMFTAFLALLAYPAVQQIAGA